MQRDTQYHQAMTSWKDKPLQMTSSKRELAIIGCITMRSNGTYVKDDDHYLA